MDNQIITSGYSEEIHLIFDAARTRILKRLPEAIEELDPKAGLLAISLKPGYKGMIFTLLPAKAHLTIGFYQGSLLPDPDNLLTGTGKVHRHVKISSMDELESEPFLNLLDTAIKTAKDRLGV